MLQHAYVGLWSLRLEKNRHDFDTIKKFKKEYMIFSSDNYILRQRYSVVYVLCTGCLIIGESLTRFAAR